jgi:2-oxopent-4-enoate/cis-2-oxohex-4-enoate hydratase
MNSPTISAARIAQLGDELFESLRSRSPVEPLTDREPGLTLEQAYRIQEHVISRRLALGDRIVGKKIGLTSRVVQRALGVSEPDFGQLLASMVATDTIAAAGMLQPRAEGEIAFLLERDLAGPGVTNADVIRATRSVMPCFEIVDSRVRDWKIKLQDTVADNGSAALFVLGDRAVDLKGLDLSTCGMVLEKNGVLECTGAGAAALGSPVNCVAWLANALGRFGKTLRAGEIILSGSLGALIPVTAGDSLHLSIGGIGSASVRFV